MPQTSLVPTRSPNHANQIPTAITGEMKAYIPVRLAPQSGSVRDRASQHNHDAREKSLKRPQEPQAQWRPIQGSAL
jgi:hypothetical protein